ncbi:hypothetical protein F4861DRAFT_530502 [Xylaria intraflava]|nr:hypothetical protein F4861DRAFT_530502 [Xylaria intraflava]
MESASPTASTSTNRGGRPKDWTVARIRRYIRLYLFTALSRDDILKLLEEDEFKPGKDAANKVKNSALGNDPRWLRPRSEMEERNRIRGLRNSLSRRRGRLSSASPSMEKGAAKHSSATPFSALLDNKSLAGTTIADSYRSSEEFPTMPNDDDAVASRFISGSIGQHDVSRHSTSLTTSTDASISSVWKRRLGFLPADKIKQTFTVLKRCTFPKGFEFQHTADASPSLFQGPGFHSYVDHIDDPYNATYALPGDFLNPELLHRWQHCVADSPVHRSGVCWCRVAEQVPPQYPWATLQIPFDISDPALMMKDAFGNTVFHRFAAMSDTQDLFLSLVPQALHDPRLPLRDSNTAGQTFLHVLHRSWFQADSRLGELIDLLRSGNFDFFATDVYGRSFYHLLPADTRAKVRFSFQPSDYRLNRRDAFGIQLMDTQLSPNTGYHVTQDATMSGINTASSRLLPRINTQTAAAQDRDYAAHAELLETIRRALEFGPHSFRSAQTEDFQGRNGFHAVAEVDFGLDPSNPQNRVRGHLKDSPRMSPKRKHTEDEEIDKPRTANDSPRLLNVRNLIDAHVDVNQYDKQGNTPLMSFVVHSSDTTKYDKEETETIIQVLVKEAGARLEARNRNGETVLHLAARHGKPIALHALLDLGANRHTRNGQGLDILQVVQGLYLATEHDDKNNARFQACLAILAGSDGKYTEQGPTLLQEWGMN